METEKYKSEFEGGFMRIPYLANTGEGVLNMNDGTLYRYSLKGFIDALRKINANRHFMSATESEVLDALEMQGRSHKNIEDIIEARKERLREKEETEHMRKLVAKYRAEYENACDDLYYGIGYSSWLKYQREIGSDMSDDEGKLVWKAAFKYMAEQD